MKTGKRIILGLAGGALLFTGAKLGAFVLSGDLILDEDRWRVKCRSTEAEVCVGVLDFGLDGQGENVTVECINTGLTPPPSSSFFVNDNSSNGTCVAPCEGASITIACETPNGCEDLYLVGAECTTLDEGAGPNGERQFKQIKDDDGKKGF